MGGRSFILSMRPVLHSGQMQGSNPVSLVIAHESRVVNAIASDLHKAPGQNMHGEAPQHLYPRHCNRPACGSFAIILCQEGYLITNYVYNALICDGHPMGVLPQVFHHMMGTGQRRLAMHHPGGFVSPLYPVFKQGKLVFFS